MNPDKTIQRTLLLVEPCDKVAAVVCEAFAGSIPSVKVVRALNLLEARSWLDFNTPDIAIVASEVPDGRGIALLHPDRNRVHFPVVILAKSGSEADVVEAIKAGAVDYQVSNPQLPLVLPGVVENSLRQWGGVIRQRMTEDALKDSEERFRLIFHTTAAGMVLISPNYNILQVNPAFCSFVGYEESDLLSRSIFDLVHQEDAANISSLYCDLFNQKIASADCERRYLRKDGGIVWGHVSVACVNGNDGRPAYCIALVQDISLRKALEEQLLRANRELDAFVHTVSHDLRSPLTPILGYLHFIFEQFDEQLSLPLKEMLKEVLKESERMSEMLEDLLAFATAGSLPVPEQPVSGKELAGNLIMKFSSNDSATPLVIGQLPDMLVPKTLCMQILDNLVGNAIHYAPGGEVIVSGERERGMIRLSVRDHGAGVPDEEKERIFELFYRGSSGRKTTGTGIGLATIKKIASLYNGRVWVEDAPGGGSIFNVELCDGL